MQFCRSDENRKYWTSDKEPNTGVTDSGILHAPQILKYFYGLRQLLDSVPELAGHAHVTHQPQSLSNTIRMTPKECGKKAGASNTCGHLPVRVLRLRQWFDADHVGAPGLVCEFARQSITWTPTHILQYWSCRVTFSVLSYRAIVGIGISNSSYGADNVR